MTGVYRLMNIGPPTRLPKSLSYADLSLVEQANEGAKVVKDNVLLLGDQFMDGPEAMEPESDESVSYRSSERSQTRKAFEVPTQPKVKKPDKAKKQPKPKPKPKPKSMAAVEKVVPAKRRASEAGDGDEEQYLRLRDLEQERSRIEAEKTEISKRQADRKREEVRDTDRLLELRGRSQVIDEMEGQLLKGKSAQWLLAYQREHGEGRKL
ncbi:hypothetical protein M3J09_000602 [Ascochyta lentis]